MSNGLWEPKFFWRCTVCNDIHFGVKPPEICPTCGEMHKYIRVNQKEAELVFEGLSA
ncbi:MAG: hypothetical protein V1494_07130 [Candidatus Diapherotrites archaeon]